MQLRLTVSLAIFYLISTAATAAEYLTSVESEVFQASGSAVEIGARANRCIAQLLAPGIQGGQLILSNDGTTIVANNVLTYDANLVRWKLRSHLTFEARDGRFKITHSNIERFNDLNSEWGGVGKWWGSPWEEAQSALRSTSSEIADCVIKPAKDW